MIYLDTHVVVWLSEGTPEKLTLRGRRMLENEEVRISAFVRLELLFMYEIGRLRESPARFFDDLCHRLQAEVCRLPAESICEAAERLAWTRDPFDRLIVGNAAAQRAKLITKDQSIRDNYKLATW